MIVVGTAVAFPNKDNVRHHVYSFSPAKRFEVPLYAGVPTTPILFDKAGVVVLGCNIHDWMVGYIYVSESPYFGKTGIDGKAVITGLPQRAYLMRVWHPQSELDESTTGKNVDLGNNRSTQVAWVLKLKPEVKVRRAPVGGHGVHYRRFSSREGLCNSGSKASADAIPLCNQRLSLGTRSTRTIFTAVSRPR